MAIHIPPGPSRWSAKHWILVTLIGTLVAIAIVAVISISLSPARIHFFIRSATFERRPNDRYYNFTLVANNTSRRTAVRYVALSAEIWYSSTGWVPAEVYTIALLSKWQPGRNATNILFSGSYWQYDVPSSTANNTMVSDSDWPNTTVVVIAKVWFKFGLAQTRLYNVRASCKPVDFFVNSTNTIFPVNCKDG